MFLEGFRFQAATNKKKKRCKQDLFKKTFDILVSYNSLGLKLVDGRYELVDTLNEVNGEAAKVAGEQLEADMLEPPVVKKKIDLQSLFQMCANQDKVSLGDVAAAAGVVVVASDKEKM
jgi:hypothetical protein